MLTVKGLISKINSATPEKLNFDGCESETHYANLINLTSLTTEEVLGMPFNKFMAFSYKDRTFFAEPDNNYENSKCIYWEFDCTVDEVDWDCKAVGYLSVRLFKK